MSPCASTPRPRRSGSPTTGRRRTSPRRSSSPSCSIRPPPGSAPAWPSGRNPARAGEGPLDLRLDGRNLRLVSAAIDGAPVPQNALALDDEGLTVAAAHVPDAFTWEAETEIAPEANTALEGLYMSRGMYCTQCEAQGFRKITFWPDRPDVMATLPRADRGRRAGPALQRQPRCASGAGFAEWEDPFPKPSLPLRAGRRASSTRSRTASPPAPGARCCCRSGCAPATRTAAPTPWTR